jgi:hypothetical protein
MTGDATGNALWWGGAGGTNRDNPIMSGLFMHVLCAACSREDSAG